MNNWEQTSIGDFIDFNPTESIKKGSIARKIGMDKLGPFQRKINGSEFTEYSAGPKFKNKDTLVAKITPCLENGKTAYVDILNEDEIAYGSSEFIVLRENEKSDSKFIYYLARSPLFRDRAISCMEGTSGRKRVNEGALKRQEILVPNLPTQQKIASVLSVLDDKIELNNNINAELEQMAKTLYDYWFVQFDFPNENGKPYKSSGGEMVYNEILKKEIPKGWKVKKLEEVVTVVRGASPRPIDDFLSNQGLPWIKISDATKSENRFILQTKQFILKSGESHTRVIEPESLILSNSASPAIPRIVMIRSGIHDGWLLIKDFKFSLSKDFLYQYFVHERPRIINLGSGSIFKNLKTDYVKGLNILLPPEDILKKSNITFSSINNKIYNSTNQNQELASLRDWLLPMLMNGQVKVVD